MSNSQLLELCQLAEKHCPQVLMDLPIMTDSDAIGVLSWLRRISMEGDNG